MAGAGAGMKYTCSVCNRRWTQYRFFVRHAVEFHGANRAALVRRLAELTAGEPVLVVTAAGQPLLMVQGRML